ncbi:hypothetical protein X805_29280 [Sphaerotilus natans subsp. natans DSM 6575]|uniref:Uncharacterized protein n=1 Tax=Sphaerotilus natans subsp. natans DSM 6575 TaxID=1286631 RepID=A0A059KJ49_9BURK|nr:hypothetical protein X805_29280 [Sphaerotilus natans subsp. natans DSM 6575]
MARRRTVAGDGLKKLHRRPQQLSIRAPEAALKIGLPFGRRHERSHQFH